MGKSPHKQWPSKRRASSGMVIMCHLSWPLTQAREAKARACPQPWPAWRTLFPGISLSVKLHKINVLVKPRKINAPQTPLPPSSSSSHLLSHCVSGVINQSNHVAFFWWPWKQISIWMILVLHCTWYCVSPWPPHTAELLAQHLHQEISRGCQANVICSYC